MAWQQNKPRISETDSGKHMYPSSGMCFKLMFWNDLAAMENKPFETKIASQRQKHHFP